MPINNKTAGESLGVEEKNWKELFDKRFPYLIVAHEQILGFGIDKRNELQHFISSLLKKNREAAYLAGAEAHEAACRVEKKESRIDYDASNIHDVRHRAVEFGYNDALTEVEAKSAEFFKELGI